jgi:hypothetical protein
LAISIILFRIFKKLLNILKKELRVARSTFIYSPENPANTLVPNKAAGCGRVYKKNATERCDTVTVRSAGKYE